MGAICGEAGGGVAKVSTWQRPCLRELVLTPSRLYRGSTA